MLDTNTFTKKKIKRLFNTYCKKVLNDDTKTEVAVEIKFVIFANVKQYLSTERLE